MKRRPRARLAVSRDERRQTLLDAARVLFARKGYHATTVDDITREAGVAKGTFYLYFEEKRDVYWALIHSFMNLIKEIGSAVEQSTSAGDFFARAELAAHKLMRLFVDNADLARLAYRLDPELEPLLRDFYRQIAEVEARNLKAAMALGAIRKVDPLLVAYTHIGMVERVLMAIVEAPADFPPPEVVVRELMQLAFEGIRK